MLSVYSTTPADGATKRLENRVHCMFTFEFFCVVIKSFWLVLGNTNNLQTDLFDTLMGSYLCRSEGIWE